MTRSVRPRRVALPIVVLAVAMVGAGLWGIARSLRPEREEVARPLVRAGSVRDATAEDDVLPIGDGPAAYSITYVMREPGRPPVRETISVDRPYRSVREQPGQRTETSFARLASTPSRGARVVVSPPPAGVDPRPAVVVDRAVAEGSMVRRERRTVAETPCQVFRTLAPVSSATISAPLPGRHTDVCISTDGLVLEEWQHDGGRPIRQRVAVSVDRQGRALPDIDDAPTLTAAQGGGSVLAVDAGSEPQGRFFVLDAPPAGFVLRGRFSVVPPQPGLSEPAERRRAVASTADVYERGDDVLVVDRGSTLNLERAFQPRPEGRPVDLGGVLGEGELLLSWNGPEVRWADDDGKFVRVHGTIAVDDIVGVARSLRATSGGGGLVFLEP